MGRVYEALKRAAEDGAKGRADAPPHGNGANGRNGRAARRADDPELTAERAPLDLEPLDLEGAASPAVAGRAGPASTGRRGGPARAG